MNKNKSSTPISQKVVSSHTPLASVEGMMPRKACSRQPGSESNGWVGFIFNFISSCHNWATVLTMHMTLQLHFNYDVVHNSASYFTFQEDQIHNVNEKTIIHDEFSKASA